MAARTSPEKTNPKKTSPVRAKEETDFLHSRRLRLLLSLRASAFEQRLGRGALGSLASSHCPRSTSVRSQNYWYSSRKCAHLMPWRQRRIKRELLFLRCFWASIQKRSSSSKYRIFASTKIKHHDLGGASPISSRRAYQLSAECRPISDAELLIRAVELVTHGRGRKMELRSDFFV